MRTAAEMYDYCQRNNFGKGVSKKWALKHFGLLEKNLDGNENILMCFCGLHNYISATKHDSTFAYAITDRRIIMGQKKMIGEHFQSVSLNNLNDITFSSGVLMGIITIDTFKEKFNVAVDKVSGRNINDAIHSVLITKSSNNQANSNNDNNERSLSIAEEIKKFKDLLDIGAISQEEYDQQKEKLLK